MDFLDTSLIVVITIYLLVRWLMLGSRLLVAALIALIVEMIILDWNVLAKGFAFGFILAFGIYILTNPIKDWLDTKRKVKEE
jgi:hypothetical protein